MRRYWSSCESFGGKGTGFLLSLTLALSYPGDGILPFLPIDKNVFVAVWHRRFPPEIRWTPNQRGQSADSTRLWFGVAVCHSKRDNQPADGFGSSAGRRVRRTGALITTSAGFC